nr:YDG domain-containing protein [uncultured Oscillibacter sp.]
MKTVALFDKNSVTVEAVTVEGGTADPQTVYAKATSAKGTNITTGVKWSVEPPEGGKGVTVGETTGLVSVDAKAVAGSYTITATPDRTNSQGSPVSVTLQVGRTGPVATSVEVGNQSTVVPAEKNSPATVTFTATVKDQFDSEIKDASVTWSIESVTGVSIDDPYTGVVTVNNKAAATTGDGITVTATTSNGKTGSAKLTITKPASEPETVVVEDGSINVPTVAEGGKAESTFTATVTDQFGAEMKGASVTWSIEDAPAGVSINSTTGVVTVTNKAAATSGDGITVTATASNGKTGSAKLTITKDGPELDHVELWRSGAKIGSTDTLIIPASGSSEYAYSVLGVDQYGDEIKVTSPSWTFAPVDEKVTQSNGTVTVVAGAEKDKEYTLTVSSEGKSVSTTITVKDIDISWPVATIKDKPVYGNTWEEIVTLGTGSASINGKAVPGTFVLVDGESFPDAGSKTFQVNFKSEDKQYDVTKTYEEAVTIAPKEVSVTWSNTTLEYNGEDQAPSAEVSADQLVGADTLSVSVSGAAKTAGEHKATASISDDNYTLSTDSKTTPFNITPKTLTVTNGTLVISKEYDGTANITSVTGALALTGVVTGDTVTVTHTTGSAYADKNVGTGKSVTLNVELLGADAANYRLESDTYAFTGAEITAKEVTVNGIAASNKEYDGNTSAVLTYSDLKIGGMITGDQLSATADGLFENKNVGTGKTVAISGIKLTGADQGNYVLASSGNQTAASADITAKALTLGDGTVEVTKVYDGTTSAGKLEGELSLSGIIPGDSVSVKMDGVTVGAYSAADYGTYPVKLSGITLTGEDAGNYSVAGDGTYTFARATITRKVPTKDLLNYTLPDDAVYTGAAQPVAVTAKDPDAGLGTITVKYQQGDAAATTAAPVNAGDYKVIASLTEGTNYKAEEIALGSFTIAKAARDLTVSPETLILVPGALTGSIDASTSASTNMDNSAKFTYTCNDTTVAMVNGIGKVTAAGNGSTTITVTIGETNNYVAASRDVAVKAVTEPVTGVTVTGGKLTAVVSGTAIKVTGTTSDKDALGYHFTTPVVDGIVITVSDVVDGKATVTVNGTELTYTVDTSAVTVLPEVIDEITEKTTGTTGVTVEGVKDALPQSVIDKAAEEAAKNEGVTDVTIGISVEVTQDEDGKLTITPKYSVEGKDADGKTVVLVPETELPSITQPVTVTVPTELDGEDLYAKHTLPNGQVEYLPVTVESGKAIFQTDDLSGTFELVKNSDSIEITFIYADGSTQVITYSAENVGKALPTDSKSGYTFNGWNIGGSIYKTVTEELLKLDDSTAAGSFSSNSSGGGSSGGGSSSSKVTVTVKTPTGATIDPDGKVSVTKGNDQTFTITPKAGYEITDILVDGKSVMDDAVAKKNGVYTYTMEEIKAAHTLTVKTAQVQSGWPFVDVADDFWAREAIEWAYDNGYMNGYSSTIFNPSGSVTRQQLWMILARLSGQQPANMAEAKAWAVANGVSDGSNPGNAVTRQQMVTILYRYASLMGYKTSGTTDLAAFPDYTSVAAYAQDSISWAVANGIVTGTSDGKLNPGGTANRAQFAAILKRFCENIVE